MSNISRKFSDFFGLTPAQDDADFGDRYERDSYEDDYRPAGRYPTITRTSTAPPTALLPWCRHPRLRPRRSRRPRPGPRRPYSRPHLRPLDRPVAPSVHHHAEDGVPGQVLEAKVIGESSATATSSCSTSSTWSPRAQALPDFVAGLAFALRGRIQRTEGGAVFTLLPEGVELSTSSVIDCPLSSRRADFLRHSLIVVQLFTYLLLARIVIEMIQSFAVVAARSRLLRGGRGILPSPIRPSRRCGR